ncbi:IS3 family transposase [Veillonella sp.]|uniref:IS3 family transposase n=1 Tax=Veillonella TaxID=29465 RepID=UPI001BCCE32E|nr:IS3 family transposase [Veillonella sp.]
MIETFFSNLKIEIYYVYETEYSSFNDFPTAIEEYINYYNNKRIQKKMDALCKI